MSRVFTTSMSVDSVSCLRKGGVPVEFDDEPSQDFYVLLNDMNHAVEGHFCIYEEAQANLRVFKGYGHFALTTDALDNIAGIVRNAVDGLTPLV